MLQPMYVYRPVLNGYAVEQQMRALGISGVIPSIQHHVTIVNSFVPVEWNLPIFRRKTNIVRIPEINRKMCRFGDYIVMVFKLPELTDRWAEAIAVGGASWSLPEYCPHISVAIDPYFDVSKIAPPMCKLYLGAERKEINVTNK